MYRLHGLYVLLLRGVPAAILGIREPQLPGQEPPVDDRMQQMLLRQSAVAPGRDETTLTLGSAWRSVRGRPTRWPLGE